MRIVVINTAADSGGAISILKDFHRYIKENDSSNEWIFFLSDYYLEEADNITVNILEKSKNKIERLKLDNIYGHRLINRYNPDIVFSMQNTAIANLSVPQVLYLHQSLPFQEIKNYSFLKKEELKYALIQHILGANIKNGLKRADKIIVQTQWMKEAVIKQTKTEMKKIEVIPPSIKLDRETKNENSPYHYNKFFYPSDYYPYKNNKLIEQACNYIDSRYTNFQYEVSMTVNEKFNNKHIQSIGRVPREEVLEKIKQEVLIFPSYIETFGLPLAEGRTLNSMIFASDTPFSREILDGYENAYFFDPFDEVELADLMVKSIKGEIFTSSVRSDYIYESDSWEKVHTMLTSGLETH